jgi:NAD(P)-dependent dehydrogenase (short-subunit alcohol dehydrogenase family)
VSAVREMRIRSLTGEDTEPFAGRVAQVTGASHGIGAAAARLLPSLGAAVAVNHHRDDPATTAVVRDIQAAVGPLR